MKIIDTIGNLLSPSLTDIEVGDVGEGVDGWDDSGGEFGEEVILKSLIEGKDCDVVVEVESEPTHTCNIHDLDAYIKQF